MKIKTTCQNIFIYKLFYNNFDKIVWNQQIFLNSNENITHYSLIIPTELVDDLRRKNNCVCEITYEKDSKYQVYLTKKMIDFDNTSSDLNPFHLTCHINLPIPCIVQIDINKEVCESIVSITSSDDTKKNLSYLRPSVDGYWRIINNKQPKKYKEETIAEKLIKKNNYVFVYVDGMYKYRFVTSVFFIQVIV